MAGAGYKSWVDGDILTAADVNTYLMQQAVMVFDDAAARTTAITAPSEGMISYRKDDDVLEYYTGSAWSLMQFGLRQVVYFTSSGTFTKATYPWLRAVKVKLVGAGGGGGGAAATGASQVAVGGGGGGGGYAEAFVAVASLSASETVTVGAAGGGATGSGTGGSGGTTSFGAHASTNGGGGGNSAGSPAAVFIAFGGGGNGGSGNSGDLQINGDRGTTGYALDVTRMYPGAGGSTLLGNTLSTNVVGASGDGENAFNGYGMGGGGARNTENDATSRTGGSGTNGLVIVELYG